MVQFTHPSKEEIYDSQIQPLVQEIIDLCEQHEMANIIVVHCPSHTRPDMCATSMNAHEDWGTPEVFLDLCMMMKFGYNLDTTPKEPAHEDHEPLPSA
jgi:hypothetical protein